MDGRGVPVPRRLMEGTRGATALEFAILAIPFFLFVLFLFEIGLDFYYQLALDYAVQEGGRKLQTGQGNAATSLTAFVNDCMCPPVASLLNCNNISLSIYPVPTPDYYQNAMNGAGFIPLSSGSLNTASWSVSTGARNQPMFMQAIYTSVSVVGMLLPFMSVDGPQGRVHVTTSSIGFLNEPFAGTSTICGVKQ